ncbi:hypothetical protein ABK040_015566 [Willaertia magna]
MNFLPSTNLFASSNNNNDNDNSSLEGFYKQSYENGSRNFFQNVWNNNKIEKDEKFKQLLTLLLDFIFKIPEHVDEEKPSPTSSSRTSTQSNATAGAGGNRLQQQQQILRMFQQFATTGAIPNQNQGPMNFLNDFFANFRNNEDSDDENDNEQEDNHKVPTDIKVIDATEWLRYILCEGNIYKEDYFNKILSTNRGVCGKSWVPGQICFKCRTCQKDPTCAICEECFKNGNHEGHDYAMVTSSSGMCDCGDAESWDTNGFCCNHSGSRSDPIEHLTQEYKYLLECINKALFGDDGVLIRYVKLISNQYDALENDKEREDSFIYQKLNQNFSHILKSITEYLKVSPCMKRLAYYELRKNCDLKEKETSSSSLVTVLDFYLKNHYKLSKIVKANFYFLYSGLLTDLEFKVFFAEKFTLYYSSITKDYITYLKKKEESRSAHLFDEEDDEEEEEDIHITSLSVQMFTVPTIATKLLKENDLLPTILNTLIELSEDQADMDSSRNNKLYLKPSPRSKKLSALYHVFYDLMYSSMHHEFSNALLLNDDNLHKFLTFLSYIQASCDVKRQDSDESQWMMTFNLEMSSFPKVFRYIIQAIEDYKQEDAKENIKQILNQFVTFTTKFIQDDNLEIDTDGLVKTNTFNTPITYHLPIHRLGTMVLVELLSRWPNISLEEVFSSILAHNQKEEISKTKLNEFLLQLMDHGLKEFVTGATIRARLWERNHEHIIDQQYNFESEKFLDYTLCLDMFLIQVSIGLINNNDIIYKTLFKKFNNTLPSLKLYKVERLEEDEDKRNILEEEFIRLILTIYTNRIYMGSMPKSEIARKLLLHRLFLGKGKFSKLCDSVPKVFRSAVDMKELVNEVANYHKPKIGGQQGFFTVKDSCWEFLEPYFITYNQQSVYQAMEKYKESGKKHSLVLSLDQPIPPVPEQLSGITNIIYSHHLYKIIFIVLYRTIQWRKTSPQEHVPAYVIHALYYSLNALLGYGNNSEGYTLKMPQKIKLSNKIESVDDIPLEDGLSPLLYIMQTFETIDGEEYSILQMLFENPSDFTEKVLNRLSELNEQCDKVILSRKESSTKSIASAEEKELKKKRALEKRKKIMEQMKKNQSQFEKLLDTNETTEEVETEDQIKCAFCHEHKSPQGSENIYLLSQIINSPAVQVTAAQNNKDLFGKLETKVIVDIGKYTELFADVNREHGIQMHFCSHVCHSDCFDRYYANLNQEDARRRRYKGYGQINLEAMEILCPVCNRLCNCLCPLLPTEVTENIKISNQSMLDDDDITKIDIGTVTKLLTESKIEFTKTIAQGLLPSFCETIAKKKNTDSENEDEEPTSPEDRNDVSYLCNTLSYVLATEEISQRIESPNLLNRLSNLQLKSLRHLVENIIAFQSATNEAATNLTTQHLKAICACVLGMKSNNEDGLTLYEDGKESNSYLPFLSSDMFTLFIRTFSLLLATTSSVCQRDFYELLKVFYLGHYIQVVVQLKLRAKQDIIIGVESIDKAINELSNNPVLNIIPSYNELDSSINNIENITKMMLTFIRRVSLFHSLLYTECPIPEEETDIEVNVLSNYLHLPKLSDLVKILTVDNQVSQLIEKWIDQLETSLKSFSHKHDKKENKEENEGFEEEKDEEEEELELLIVDSLIPFFGYNNPFSFVKLPQRYEDIFLKYHNMQCPTCGKKLETPVMCLITGEMVWLRKCTSCEKHYTKGKLTRYIQEKLSNCGLFLVVPWSCLLLMREGRNSFLSSVYLDEHGEEDFELRRGSPLTLHKERLKEHAIKFIKMNFDQDTLILEKTSNLHSGEY